MCKGAFMRLLCCVLATRKRVNRGKIDRGNHAARRAGDMRRRHWLLSATAATCVLTADCCSVHAAEAAFGTYGLGGNAFGAGVTPPAGTYVTAVTAYYQGEIN